MSNGAHAREGSSETPHGRALTAAESGAFLLERSATTIDRTVLQRLITAANGNPETLTAFTETLSVDELMGRTPLPHVLPIWDAELHDTLARLTSEERDTLLLVALDRSHRVDVLTRALGHERERVWRALEAHGVLAISGNRVSVCAPGVVAQVRNLSTADQQQTAHTVLSQALIHPDDADYRAWHIAQSCRGADAGSTSRILDGLERARARGGHAAVSELYEGAALSATTADERGTLLVFAAESAWQGGAAARAEAILAQTAGIRLSADTLHRAARIAGMAALSRGRAADALHRYLDAATLAGPLAPELVARAAGVAWWEGRPEWADRVASVAATLDDTSVLGRAVRLAAPAAAQLMRGAVEEAGAGLRAALALETNMESLRGLCFLGEVASLIGDDIAGIRILGHAVDRALQLGDQAELPFTLQSYALLLASAGRVWEARAIAAQGMRAAEELNEERRGAFQMALYAQQDAMLGNTDHAYAWGRTAVSDGSGGSAALARWSLGRVELMRGRAAESVRELTPVIAPGTGHPVFRFYALPDYIEALVQAGDTAQARREITAYQQWERAGSELARAVLPRLLGAIAEADASGTHFRAAVQSASGRPFEQARARLQLGRHLRRVRRRVESRDELRTALSVFDSLGVAGWGALARRELRASGEVPPGDEAPIDLSALTAQELRVAQLVLREDSNRHAATRLGLSTRTVEFHLAKAYAKLGVNSRTELARVFAYHNSETPS